MMSRAVARQNRKGGKITVCLPVVISIPATLRRVPLVCRKLVTSNTGSSIQPGLCGQKRQEQYFERHCTPCQKQIRNYALNLSRTASSTSCVAEQSVPTMTKVVAPPELKTLCHRVCSQQAQQSARQGQRETVQLASPHYG